MSGLLSYASPWASDNSDQSTTKKRTPSLGLSNKNKTIKKNPNLGANLLLSEYPEKSELGPASYQSIDDIQEKNEMRNSRVQEIIQNITNVKYDDDGSGLASFDPLPLFSQPKPVIRAEYNPVTLTNPAGNMGYTRDNNLGGNSYYNAYSQKDIPSYLMQQNTNAKMNTPPRNANSISEPVYDRMMEKLNKMIYLLEEQQKEPGKHIMEEFILYTFLGVFIIFIVDSFSRSGKYIR